MKQNFHLRFDRDLSKAGSTILRDAVRHGFLSQHEAMIHDQQWTQFSIYVKESHEVDILEFVNKKLVRQYGEELCIQVYHRNLSQQQAVNLLQTVHLVMDLATNGGWRFVLADIVDRIVFPTHARITVPRSLDQIKFEAAMEDIRVRFSEQLAMLIKLVRYLGISLREAFFFDAQSAEKDARAEKIFYVSNGEDPYEHRVMNISNPKQMDILETISEIQNLQRGYPATLKAWRRWKQKSLPAAKELLLAHGLSINDCRAAYACELYEQLSGHQAPILGGKAPNELDLEARNQLAYELGYLRIWETDAHVGARAP
ncbi:integrase [Pseudomonas wadenswilerensis]|uniref:Putative phage integrase n=1 Tax=Pseudomonas wadenswilerensis TaxID=1785161 RepID=A0A380SVW8_9PSED|nr:integrase [Pseudomonas wadenswilerensis]SUQ61438.1 putative phage integrase [Pseudomonas wadenswilerensis]